MVDAAIPTFQITDETSYDVGRIAQFLRDEPFVSGEPYAQDSWVVIPFELKPDTKTEGAP